MNCPHCNKPLKVIVQKSAAEKKKERQEKDPYEPMSLETFVAGCLDNTRLHIKIIGHWAEELRESCGWEGFQTRGEWTNWLQLNLRGAVKISYTWSAKNGRAKLATAMQAFVKHQKKWDYKSVKLESLFKEVEKI